MSNCVVHVAVGVIKNQDNEVLISKRADHVHQGGLWEFPGGKIEAGEKVVDALTRELKEELGITCEKIQPLSQIEFDYGDKKVCLHTRIVNEFTGSASGCEGQEFQWVNLKSLDDYSFPEANITILRQIQLPEFIQITGQYSTIDELLSRSEQCFQKKISMLHFRAHHLSDTEYVSHAKALKSLCADYDVVLIINRDYKVFEEVGADGLHLTRYEALKYTNRPVGRDKYLSVSCHSEHEIKIARNLKADYCFISPVKNAISHDAGEAIGFEAFKSFCHKQSFPLYALGGMTSEDIKHVRSLGGAGVAGISEYW